MAVEKGRLDILQALFDHGSDVNERVGPNAGSSRQKRKHLKASETPLMTAVNNRLPEVASWLLERGANAEIMDLNGKTAMMLAIEHGAEDVMRILERAADRAVDDEDDRK